MGKLVELTENEWWDTFKPIKNPHDDNASFEGHMFETYGVEVKQVSDADPLYTWTYIDGDDGATYIINGRCIVNRIGYFITEVPWDESKDYQMTIIEPSYECPNCEEVWEDEQAKFHIEKFWDLQKCAKCASIKEMTLVGLE
jgi:hypothetical protein